jgi:hypothetical protein
MTLCAECKAEISPKRLRAVPNALFCVDCQATHDEPLAAVYAGSNVEEFNAADIIIVRPVELSRLHDRPTPVPGEA